MIPGPPRSLGAEDKEDVGKGKGEGEDKDKEDLVSEISLNVIIC